ncbi:MAG: OmpH family outer membrane protein [Vicingaceae bacterium]
MKTTERILLYTLLIAVVPLYIFHFQGHSEESMDTANDSLVEAAIEAKNGKIYFVNTDSIWANYSYVKDAMAEMTRKKSQYEGRLEKQYREFEAEVGQFQQKGSSMSEIELQLKQRELVRKETELGKLREELELRMMQEEKEWNDKLRAKIVSSIEKYTADRSYDYVLGYSIQSNIILANDSLDLTADVLKGLNDEYNKDKSVK